MPTKKPVAKKKVVAKKTTKAVAKKVTKKPVAKKTLATKVAKKVTKKTVAKKTVKKPVKKAAAVKKPAKDLVLASDQESFWTTDGEVLNSLVALGEAFGKMDKGVYHFHAEGDQNDFTVWVETVLCDGDCAVELSKAKSHRSAKTIVNKHLKNYTR